MDKVRNRLYTSRIIKATALITDTKSLLQHWDNTVSTPENLAKVREQNIFGKTSRSRVDDVLRIFRRRYLVDSETVEALTKIVDLEVNNDILFKILYFYSAQADHLLHDFVTDFVLPRYKAGLIEITTDDFVSQLEFWKSLGNMTSDWSEKTTRTVAKNVSATLRDFGILVGGTTKRIAAPYLPIGAFVYVAFILNKNISGNQLVHHYDWHLFLLDTQQVERLFMEAHQLGLLEYYAAGSTVRVDFPTDLLKEYVDVIIQRAA